MLSTTPLHEIPPSNPLHLGSDLQDATVHQTTDGDRCSLRSQVRTRLPEQHPDRSCSAAGTRVGIAALGMPEAAPSGVTNDRAHIPAQTFGHVRKRSLRKAVGKARAVGSAVYRGKVLHADVSLPLLNPKPPSPDIGPRVKIFSWNCDGLSSTLYNELLCWLDKHDSIDAILLQETHWSRTMEWSERGWHFCHSASAKANTAGVLIGVRARFAKASTINWHEHIPGRLLQMRCFSAGQHIDLVCAYQHAMGYGDSATLQRIYQRRRSFWKALDALLASLPFRSQVVLGGDMNCNVTQLARLVGPGVLAGSNTEAAKQDRMLFMQILQMHQLCILNSWGRPQATYHHPKGSSQIDFIATRLPLADGHAKECQPYESLLAGWRSAGHKPLVASLRPQWKPWTMRRNVKDEAIQAARHKLGYNEGLLQCVHSALQQTHVQPLQWPVMPPRQYQDQHIYGFWQLRRKVSRLQWRDQRGLFQAWRLSVKLKAAKRELDRRHRQAKRQRILEVLQQAEDAAKKKLAGGFYKYVKLLSPKSAPQRIRLRDDSGCLVDQNAECKLLAFYAAKLFKGQSWELPSLLPVPAQLFSAAQWHNAFRLIPRGKAVPIFTPPLACWKDRAPEFCTLLEATAASCLSARSPTIPIEWASVQIAWLPKPNKSPSTPSNLRTIGLMSGDQKALLHIVKTHIRDPIMRALQNTPQYAYRTGASTHDAILRSSAHCSRTRLQLESVKSDLTTKLSGRHRTELTGGLMANLDLAKAFDTLPYSEIYYSLQSAGVDEALCRLIVHIHASTRCVILHGSSCEVIAMSRGLRQGCPIAPYIFAAWSVRVCDRIDSILGSGWCLSHLTLFSDDTHSYWSIHSVADMSRATEQLLTVIRVLTEMGMRVNFTKSSAVCALKGLGALRAQRKHFCWHDGSLCLRLRQESADLYIPLGETLEYLGVILSYHHFELQTAKLRAAKADANFARLGKVLRTNGPLSERQRLRVYRACVLSSLIYGLAGVGFSKASFKVAHTKSCMHLRKLLRVYQEGVTNQSVLERAGINLVQDLRKRAAAQLQTIQADTGHSPTLKHPELHRAGVVLEGLDAAVECLFADAGASLVRLCASATAIAECSVCGQSFAGSHNLVMHINSKHPEINQAAKVAFQRHKHALHGIPRCRFCRVVQHSWQVLEQHVTCGMCPVIKAGVGRGFDVEAIYQSVLEHEKIDPPIPPTGIEDRPTDLLFNRPEHVQAISTVLKDVATVQQYVRECALCGQRLQDANRLKDHWRKTHAVAWRLAATEARSHARSLNATFVSPCRYCKSTAKDHTAHAMQCPALFQLLSVRILHRHRCQLDDLQKEVGPSKRQSERTAAYHSYSATELPIAKAFRASAVAQGAPAPVPKPSDEHLSSSASEPRSGNTVCHPKPPAPMLFQQFPGASTPSKILKLLVLSTPALEGM